MKERLHPSERHEDFLGRVLRAALRTKTLVFNEVRRCADDPDILKDIGMGLAVSGLIIGFSGYVATVEPRSLEVGLFTVGWIAVFGGLGTSLYIRGLHR